jgi:hypothetical protein
MKETKKYVRHSTRQGGAQVMLEVPDGRIGHRHAWWPMDKYDEEYRDWAEQRRELNGHDEGAKR